MGGGAAVGVAGGGPCNGTSDADLDDELKTGLPTSGTQDSLHLNEEEEG